MDTPSFFFFSIMAPPVQVLSLACPDGCRPEQPPVPRLWSQIFICMNSICPFILAFFYMIMAWAGLQAHQHSLQDTITSAKTICRALVDFNLESVDVPHEHGSDQSSSVGPSYGGAYEVIKMLHDLVINMRAYRPFLPHHLVAPRENSSEMSIGMSPSHLSQSLSPMSVQDDEEGIPDMPSIQVLSRRGSSGYAAGLAIPPVRVGWWCRKMGFCRDPPPPPHFRAHRGSE